MVLDEALATGAGGPCRAAGRSRQDACMSAGCARRSAPSRMPSSYDNLRKPGAWRACAARPVALPALAMAQAVNASGRDLIAAIVAGVEVMFRIGAATLHSPGAASASTRPA